jgi:hypothetical protein
MAGPPTYEELQAQLSAAIEQLEAVMDLPKEGIAPGRSEGTGALAIGLRTTLLALSASLGECRQEIPYSPLHPVLGKDGKIKWCCNHAKQHCGM